MMRNMVRDFAKKEIEPFIESMEQGEFPREILKKMGELGLMGITVPENMAGQKWILSLILLRFMKFRK